MAGNFDEAFTSPDGKHHAALTYINEIRFGPAWFSLEVDDYSFGDRTFGGKGVWSSDSSIFCVTEWDTSDRSRSGVPTTWLVGIRVADMHVVTFQHVEHGFVYPQKFRNKSLVVEASTSYSIDSQRDWQPPAEDRACEPVVEEVEPETHLSTDESGSDFPFDQSLLLPFRLQQKRRRWF